MSDMVQIEKSKLIGLHIGNVSGMMEAWVCTFSPVWRDPSVTDINGYRKYLLGVAKEHEVARAALVGQTPGNIKDMARQQLNAMTQTSYRTCYTRGIPVEIDIVQAQSAIEHIDI